MTECEDDNPILSGQVTPPHEGKQDRDAAGDSEELVPVECADVFFEGDQGVAMPDWTDEWTDAHYAVLENEHVKYDSETGEYVYNTPLPDHVKDRLGNGLPEGMQVEDEMVVEDGDARLSGRVKNPHSLLFRLEAVDVLCSAAVNAE